MKEPPGQSHAARYGLAWIFGLVTAAVLIFFLDTIVEAFRDTAPVVVLLPEAPQLRPGNPVWVAGHAVGSVEAIHLTPPTRDSLARAAAIVRIPEDYLTRLPQDSYARLAVPRPTANPVIDIVPGTPGGVPLGPGDTIRTRPSIDAAALSARLSGTMAAMDSLMALVDTLQRVAGEAGVEGRLRLVLAGIDAVRAEAGVLAEDLRTTPARTLFEEGGAAATLRVLLGRVGDLRLAFGARVEQLGFGRDTLAPLRQEIRDFQASRERVERNLDSLQTMVEEGRGFPVRFERDTAIVAAIHEARAELDLLIAEIIANPFRLVF